MHNIVKARRVCAVRSVYTLHTHSLTLTHTLGMPKGMEFLFTRFRGTLQVYFTSVHTLRIWNLLKSAAISESVDFDVGNGGCAHSSWEMPNTNYV